VLNQAANFAGDHIHVSFKENCLRGAHFPARADPA